MPALRQYFIIWGCGLYIPLKEGGNIIKIFMPSLILLINRSKKILEPGEELKVKLYPPIIMNCSAFLRISSISLEMSSPLSLIPHQEYSCLIIKEILVVIAYQIRLPNDI